MVLFSIHHERLEALLVKQQNDWRLPGGCAAMDEDLDTSALRYLHAETGVQGVYLEQLYTFSRPDWDLQAADDIGGLLCAGAISRSWGLGNLSSDSALRWFAVTQLPSHDPEPCRDRTHGPSAPGR